MITLNDTSAAVLAHDKSAGAHGFGVYTVAQLNAFTNGNRPTSCVYCSDCLTPEGVGSPVVWTGSKWVCTCSGIDATTDLLTFFRGCRAAGKEFYSPAGKLTRIARTPLTHSGQFTTNVASVIPMYDGEGNALDVSAVGSTVRTADYFDSSSVGGSYTGRSLSVAYIACGLSFGAASDATEEYNFRFGFSSADAPASALSADEATFVYDRGNIYGLGGGGNWSVLTRKGSVNTAATLGLAPSLIFTARQTLEVILELTECRFFIDGALVATHTTNIPTSVPSTIMLRPNISLAKTAGSASRAARFAEMFHGTRYS